MTVVSCARSHPKLSKKSTGEHRNKNNSFVLVKAQPEGLHNLQSLYPKKIVKAQPPSHWLNSCPKWILSGYKPIKSSSRLLGQPNKFLQHECSCYKTPFMNIFPFMSVRAKTKPCFFIFARNTESYILIPLWYPLIITPLRETVLQSTKPSLLWDLQRRHHMRLCLMHLTTFS